MTHRTTRDAFLAAFASGKPAARPWLREQRRHAIARFAERGLPTTRDEEWKYTSLAPLAAMPARPGGRRRGRGADPEALAPFLIGPASWNRLVFLNGRYVAKLSTVRWLPAGGHVGSLAEALITDAEAVRPYLTAGAEESGDAFGALNAAFWADGAFIRVPAGASVEEPTQLLFLATAREAPHAEHSRSLVVLERDSRLALVESYVALGASAYLTNAMTEVVLRPGADLDHHRIVLEGRGAVHLGQTRVREERDSHLASCTVAFGGRLVRNEVGAILGAEGAECRLSGLFVVGGDQHVDIHTVIDHVAPRATSRQLYKGVLDGTARGVFSGRVVVRPGANGTDAHQTNKNLLLSDGSRWTASLSSRSSRTT